MKPGDLQHRNRHPNLALGLGLFLVLFAGAGPAAEVTGTVQLKRTGLFRAEAGAGPMGGVSVSLEPLEGQPWPRVRRETAHRMVFKDKRPRPPFLTVRRGDSVSLVNEDEVYHEIFALSPAQPIEARLGKASQGTDARHRVELGVTGTWHLFCRIHSRMYARIDAVDSPLIQTVEPNEAFRFSGLRPGRWSLRAAALGAETRQLEVVALTGPPPVEVEVSVKGGGASTSLDGLPVQGRIDQLYPKD
jgi:plastocyanin